MGIFSQWTRRGVCVGTVLFVVGCASQSRAPIVDRGATGTATTSAASGSSSVRNKVALPPRSERDWRPAYHIVQKGDTLYSIALEYGFDYKEIAEWNSLADPNVILIGQQLRLTAPVGWQPNTSTSYAGASTSVTTMPLGGGDAAIVARPVVVAVGTIPLKTEPKALKQVYSGSSEAATSSSKSVVAIRPAVSSRPAPPVSSSPPVVASNSVKPEAVATSGDGEELVRWSWPTDGKVIATFNEAASIKGIDIGGKTGQPVLAAAEGKVVYSGSGLRGYGKLVILRHNKTYLSAYAHNDQILVKEGQAVTRGQKIAEMGNTGSDQVKLHFEIRQLGKPVDPQKYLPSR